MENRTIIRPRSFACYKNLPTAPCEIDSEDRFICVVFADENAQAGTRIIRRYQELGFKVWYDTTLSSATLFSEKTRDALNACKAVVFIHDSGSIFDSYYSHISNYVRMIGQRRFILHLEEFRLNSIGMDERVFHRNIDPDSPDLDRRIKSVYLDASPLKKCVNEVQYDLGLVVCDADTQRYSTINMRTHEVWDENRLPLGTIDSETLNEYVERRNTKYKPLPVSYATEYSESDEERATVQEIAQAKLARWKAYLEAEREEEDAAKRASEQKHSNSGYVFPSGYPYMDEFERLGSD